MSATFDYGWLEEIVDPISLSVQNSVSSCSGHQRHMQVDEEEDEQEEQEEQERGRPCTIITHEEQLARS